MIGIVITGHGQFAFGMTSAVEMIAGKQARYAAVVFDDQQSLAYFEHELGNAVISVNSGNGVIIMSDLQGGTPFKTAVMISRRMDNVYVVGGTNLAMILEGCLSRINGDDVKDFGRKLVAAGANQVVMFEPEFTDQEDSEEGI